MRPIGPHYLVVPDSGLHPEGLHPTHGVAPSRFRALRNIRCCSPPWRSGQCLSPDVADHPLRPATRLSLGRPLPYQQADMTRAAPKPIGPEGSPPLITRKCFPVILSSITWRFHQLFWSSGYVTHALLTRSPLITLLGYPKSGYRSTCML